MKFSLKNIGTVIKHSPLILSGVWNKNFGSKEVQTVAERRLKICRTNKCKFYDPLGQSEKAKDFGYEGQECCGSCGCLLANKVNSMLATCTLKDLGGVPLWTAYKSEKISTKK